MADFTVKRIEDMEAVYAVAFIRARASLGASSFGMQVMEFPPGADQHPEHTHAEDGQEEVYIALRGGVDGRQLQLLLGAEVAEEAAL